MASNLSLILEWDNRKHDWVVMFSVIHEKWVDCFTIERTMLLFSSQTAKGQCPGKMGSYPFELRFNSCDEGGIKR
jgi:hypothetical protein